MRKCYVCQHMKPVVTVVTKPDGKRGLICPACYTPEPEQKPVSVAGYWSNPSGYAAIAAKHGGWTPKPLTREEKQEMEGCGA